MKLDILQKDDWILLWNPKKIKWIPTRVTIEILYSYENLKMYDPSDIKPIMITEKFLQKNGFTKEEIIKGFIEWVSSDRRIILRNDSKFINSNKTWSIHVDSEDMCSICNAELSFVHELQHILKHCEIRKEIKV